MKSSKTFMTDYYGRNGHHYHKRMTPKEIRELFKKSKHGI